MTSLSALEHTHASEADKAGCPVCDPDKTVPQLNDAYRASKTVALLDEIEAVMRGEHGIDWADHFGPLFQLVEDVRADSSRDGVEPQRSQNIEKAAFYVLSCIYRGDRLGRDSDCVKQLIDAFNNVRAPETEAALNVGDIVVERDGVGSGYLCCGSGYYPHAIVVSVFPFVMVSEEGDMMWSCQKPEHFKVFGRATPDQSRAAFDRYLQRGQWAPSPSKTRGES